MLAIRSSTYRCGSCSGVVVEIVVAVEGVIVDVYVIVKNIVVIQFPLLRVNGLCQY